MTRFQLLLIKKHAETLLEADPDAKLPLKASTVLAMVEMLIKAFGPALLFVWLAFAAVACGGAVDAPTPMHCTAATYEAGGDPAACGTSGNPIVVSCDAPPDRQTLAIYAGKDVTCAPGATPGTACCVPVVPSCVAVSDLSVRNYCPTDQFFVTLCTNPIPNPGGIDCVPPKGPDGTTVQTPGQLSKVWCCR